MTKKYVDIYNMTSDTNFAPHHDGDLLTLACCMVKIRKKVGELWEDMSNPQEDLEYWIVGRVATSLNSEKKNHLVYFMKVDNVMNFAEYSNEFGSAEDENGRMDNIYEVNDESGDFFDPDNFNQLKEVKGHWPKHDIGKGKYVLLSKNYCYFDWKNEPYEEKLGEWGIPELEWIPNGNKGPFRRKYDFEKTERIIDALIDIKDKECQRHIPNKKNNAGCGDYQKDC